MKFNRIVAVTGMALAGVMVASVPAFAQQVSGYRDCGSTRTVGITSSTAGTGSTQHSYSNGQYFRWSNPSGYTSRTSASSMSAGNWYVDAYSIASASSTCFS